MKINTPFDPLPTKEGEYVARLDEFTEADLPIRNRRYFENGKWSGPYHEGVRDSEVAKARTQTSMFNLYWVSK